MSSSEMLMGNSERATWLVLLRGINVWLRQKHGRQLQYDFKMETHQRQPTGRMSSPAENPDTTVTLASLQSLEDGYRHDKRAGRTQAAPSQIGHQLG